MNIENIHQLLGLSNTDAQLADAIQAHGGSVAALSPKTLSAEGSDFVHLIGAVAQVQAKVDMFMAFRNAA